MSSQTIEPPDYNPAYVRTTEAPGRAPPSSNVGVRGWLWDNIFSSMANFSSPSAVLSSVAMAALTFGALYFALALIWAFVDFTVLSATWSDPNGELREACRPNAGACWPFVLAKSKLIIYGWYPVEELWRVNVVYAIFFVGILWLASERTSFKGWVGAFMLAVFPVLSFILLTGGAIEVDRAFWLAVFFVGVFFAVLAVIGRPTEGRDARGPLAPGRAFLAEFSALFGTLARVLLALVAVVAICAVDFGLEPVETSYWGGFLVTLVVAVTGIVASLPLGILLALGRRSRLPIIKFFSVLFIEFWRGVPLITVLFMSSVMLPLFLPEGVTFDKLLRALIGVGLFSAAYMAENIRGGLQAIPKGQYEGAMSMGLAYWSMMRLIVLPQALTIVIPGIVSTFISLFKDTTLVLIVGLFDLLGFIQAAQRDPAWSTPITSHTGYLVAAIIFWICCFSMSRYSQRVEEKLSKSRRY